MIRKQSATHALLRCDSRRVCLGGRSVSLDIGVSSVEGRSAPKKMRQILSLVVWCATLKLVACQPTTHGFSCINACSNSLRNLYVGTICDVQPQSTAFGFNTCPGGSMGGGLFLSCYDWCGYMYAETDYCSGSCVPTSGCGAYSGQCRALYECVDNRLISGNSCSGSAPVTYSNCVANPCSSGSSSGSTSAPPTSTSSCVPPCTGDQYCTSITSSEGVRRYFCAANIQFTASKPAVSEAAAGRIAAGCVPAFFCVISLIAYYRRRRAWLAQQATSVNDEPHATYTPNPVYAPPRNTRPTQASRPPADQDVSQSNASYLVRDPRTGRQMYIPMSL